MLLLAWANFKKADQQTVEKLAVEHRVVDPTEYYDWLVNLCMARFVARQKRWPGVDLVHALPSATEKRKESRGTSGFKAEPLVKSRTSDVSSSVSLSGASRLSGRERKFKPLTQVRMEAQESFEAYKEEGDKWKAEVGLVGAQSDAAEIARTWGSCTGSLRA